MREVGRKIQYFYAANGSFPASLSGEFESRYLTYSFQGKKISCEDPFSRGRHLPLGYVTDSTAEICLLVSRGPDGEFQTDLLRLQKTLYRIEDILYELHYDPTNGSASVGDLFMFAEGKGP